MPENDKWIIVYDDDDVYFTDKESNFPITVLGDYKILEFDTEEEMKEALNSDIFAKFYEED